MQIVAATWYDEFNLPFLTEYYEDFFSREAILDFYAEQKAFYGKKIIGSYPDTRVFSDGTRVIVQICQVKPKLETQYNTEDVIDVSSSIYLKPGRDIDVI